MPFFKAAMCMCVYTVSKTKGEKQCVCCLPDSVSVNIFSLCFFIIWTDKPTEEQVLCEWIQTFSASFPFALITSAYWVFSLFVLLSLVESSEVIFIFFASFHKSFLIQVWDQGRPLQSWAKQISWYLSPRDIDVIFRNLKGKKETKRGTVIQMKRTDYYSHWHAINLAQPSVLLAQRCCIY